MMSRRKGMVGAAVLTVACLTPGHADARPGWYGNVFQSPSRNLICKYRAAFDSITCGRWNDHRIVTMTSTGRAREGQRISWTNESPHTLYYGEQYRGVGSRITCGSYTNGVRCTNYQGHGFFISRTVLNLW